MAEFHEDDHGVLVAKGDSEKKKIKDQIIRNQKDKISSFFKEFRGFCKNSTTKRKNEIDLLFRELEKTLTMSEKEEFIRNWKPDCQPIIIVSTISQLLNIQNHLAGLDLSQVSFKPMAPQQQYHDESFLEDKQLENLFPQSRRTIESFVDYLEMPTDMNFDGFSVNDQFNCVTRSTGNNAQSSDEAQEDEQSESLSSFREEVASSVNTTEVVDEDINLVTTNFQQLSSIIREKRDVLPTLVKMRDSAGIDIYQKVLGYCDTKEPLLFQLAFNCDQYLPAIDQIWRDGLLNLNQKDHMKTTIFTFLLIKNIESLYKFLKFIKEIKLQEMVYQICSSDRCFQTLIEQMKRDASSMPINRRKRVDSVEKFCMKT